MGGSEVEAATAPTGAAAIAGIGRLIKRRLFKKIIMVFGDKITGEKIFGRYAIRCKVFAIYMAVISITW